MRLSGMRVAGALLLFALLNGCAAKIPFQGDRSKERIAGDLGLTADSIVGQNRCLVARYDGSASAASFECIYIATNEYGAVLDFDAKTHRFKEAMRIARPDAVTLVTRTSPLGIGGLMQMQVRHAGQYYTLEFVSADFGQIGFKDDLRTAYEHLRSIGLGEATAVPYVMRQAAPTPIIIPVYVPRR